MDTQARCMARALECLVQAEAHSAAMASFIAEARLWKLKAEFYFWLPVEHDETGAVKIN